MEEQKESNHDTISYEESSSSSGVQISENLSELDSSQINDTMSRLDQSARGEKKFSRSILDSKNSSPSESDGDSTITHESIVYEKMHIPL
jgi:hypothetical protein